MKVKTRRGIYIFWSIFIAAAAFRVAMSFGFDRPDIGSCLKHLVHGSGTITAEPERKESGQVFVISAQELFPQNDTKPIKKGLLEDILSSQQLNTSCGSDILVRVKTKLYPRFKYGDEVHFIGKLSKPFNFRSDSGRSFDYEGYLAKDNVFYEIKSATVEPEGDSKYSLFQRVPYLLYSLKRGFVHNLEHALGEPHAALAAGLVVGEKSALGADLLDQFRTVGLIHIIVLSGYNITIVGDALRRMLSFLPRVWGIVIGGIGIILFGILVGGGATVVRSCLMASVALSADLIRRDYQVGRALAFAALLMLIQNPLILLHDPSFQLSFLATLGLIILASPIESKLGFIPEKFGMRGIVASTIATQIFVSPYILYMMGQLSIIGMVVNILVLPFIPATMLFVTLTGLSGFVSSFLANAIGWITHLLLSYELFMVEHFAQMPFASVQVPIFPAWVVGGFYVVFAIVYLILSRGKKRVSKFRF